MIFLNSSNRLIAVFVFSILLLLFIIFSLILYKRGSIYIINKSKHYYLSFHKTPEFSNLIKNLEIFNKEIHFQGKKIKSNSLAIELVDESQIVYYKNNSNYFITSRISFDIKRNNFVIKINIPLQYKNIDKQKLNELVLKEIIAKLYVISHENTTTKILNNELNLYMKVFTDRPEKNPFRITIKI